MWLSRIYPFCLVCSLALSIPALADNQTFEYQLDNGLKIVVRPDTTTPLVLSEMWYKVGSSYESDGTTGVSHVLEHMMFKGTPDYPSGKIFSVVASQGGEQNAETTEDYTMYYQEWAPSNLATSFAIEADRMQHLNLDPKLFKSELQVVQEESKLRVSSDPNAVTQVRFNAAAFPNNPYAHPVIGWPGDLAQLTVDNLRAWYQTWYVPNNAILVVVGDVKPNDVYELAKQYFGNIKAKPLPVIKQFYMLPKQATTRVTVNAPANLPALFIGFNVPSAISEPNSKEPYALFVLSQLLAGNDSARLPKQLVRDKSIANDVGTDYELYARLPTLLQISANPAAGKTTPMLEQAILAEIQQLQTTLVSASELNRVKTAAITDNIYARDSITDEADMIGSFEVVGLTPKELDNFEKEINQVTAQDVQNVAEKYLVPANMTVGVLSPETINQSGAQAPQAASQGNQHVN